MFAKDRSVGTRAERACGDTLLEPLVANVFAPVWAVYKAMPRAPSSARPLFSLITEHKDTMQRHSNTYATPRHAKETRSSTKPSRS